MTAEIAVGVLIPGRRPQRSPTPPALLPHLTHLDFARHAHRKETTR